MQLLAGQKIRAKIRLKKKGQIKQLKGLLK